MKKSSLKIFFLFLFLSFLNGCSDTIKPTPEPASGEYVVNFLIGTSHIYTSAKVSKNGANKGSLTKPTIPPTKEGFIFSGWYWDEANTRLFNFSSDRVTSDIDLYAKWFTTYTITFSTPNGVPPITPIKVLKKDFLELPNPPKKEYSKFVDWYIDALFNQKFNPDLPISKNLTLYAKFETEVFKFVFYTNGGSKVATQEINSGETAKKPDSNPIKEDYFFIGWFSNAKGEGNQFDFENTKIIRRSWAYAVWASKIIIVTYNANGGRLISDKNEIKDIITEKKPSGSTATFKRPQNRKTLQFVHWCTDPGLLVEYDFSNPIKSDFILYAKWETKTFDISFENLNGASAVEKQKVSYGKTVTKPNDPTKTFSAFRGWYTSLAFDVAYNFDTPVFENKKLYAYFLTKRSVTFDPRGGFMTEANKTQLVTQGSAALPPKPPTKKNYAFVEWVSDNISLLKKYDFSTPVNENFTLYAKWVSNVATLTKLTIYRSDNPNANFRKESYSANYEGNLIRLTAPGITLTNIIPRFNTERVTGNPSPPLDARQDFSHGPIVYQLPTESGSITNFKVEISNFSSSQKDILLFKIRDVDNLNIINSTITANVSGNTIYLILPKGITPSTLRPYIETSFGSEINPKSGTLINTNQPSYTITAENNSSKTYNLDIKYIKSSNKDISSFSFTRSKNKDANGKDLVTSGNIESQINGNNIYVTLPEGSRIQRLNPTVSITGINLSPNSDDYQNFNNNVTYTVIAEDNSTKIYTVHVTVTPSSNNKITLFSFREIDNPTILTQNYTATVNQQTKVIDISLPDHIDLTSNRLIPFIITEPYVKDISPKGASDYSVSPIRYTVTAENGNENIYSIRVKKILSPVKDITSFSFKAEKNSTYLSKDYSSVIIGNYIHIHNVPHNVNISNLKPDITFIGGGTISPSLSLSQDFSNLQNHVKYIITARDGSLKTYTVMMGILPDPSKQITSFVVKKDVLNIPGQIIGNDIILTIFENLLPLRNIIPTVSYKGESISPDGQAIDIDRNSNVTYSVIGHDKKSQTYKLQVISYKSDIVEISSFSLSDKSKTILDRSRDALIDNEKLTITLNDLPETALSSNVDVRLFFKGKSSSYPSESTGEKLKPGNITITITSFDDSVSRSYALIINTVKSDKKSITSFVFDPKKNKTILNEISGVIDSETNTINVNVPFGTNVSDLLPSVNIIGASYEPVDSQNFEKSRVEYIVYADNQSRKSYFVNFNFLPNTKAEITSFSFKLSDNNALAESLTGAIKDSNSNPFEIIVVLKPNTSINHLKPSITLSEGAKISPAIDYTDFSKLTSYTVTSQDGKTTKTYVVKIIKSSTDSKNIISFKLYPSDNTNLRNEVIGNITDSDISLAVPYGTSITDILPRVQISGASYAPTGKVNFLGENGKSKIIPYTITAQDGSKKVYNVIAQIQNAIRHTISFNVGDGATSIAPITVNDGGTIPLNISTQRPGYTFSGWYTDKNHLDDQRYLVISSTIIKSDYNLFAKWIIKTYTIIFVSEGKAFSSKTITSQDNLTPPAQNPNKPNYKLTGWYEDNTSSTTSPYNNFGHPVTRSFSLYARFEKDIFVIQYVSLGKTYQKFIRKGSTFEISTEVVNPNHVILDFYENASFTKVFDFKNELVTQDKILYVKWGSTVTLDPNASSGGRLPSSQPSSIKAELNQKVTKPNDPTNSNASLTFLGWFNDSVKFDFNSNINSNITLLAKWGYLVTFDPNATNGGRLATGEPSSLKVELNQKITSPTTPTNSNASLTFLGWFNGSVKFDFNSDINSNITLLAKWGYLVTLNAGIGGSLAFGQSNPIGVTSGESLNSPLTPINRDENLSFIGWFNGSVKFDFNSNINSNITLLAKWGYLVTFDVNGGQLAAGKPSSLKVELNQKVTSPTTPTNSNASLTFLGWFNGTVKFDFNSNINSNITLLAKWGYLVTFDVNGGQLAAGQPSSLKVELNQKITSPITPTNSNASLTFLGWFNGTVKFDFNSNINSNITLLAKWGYLVTLNAGIGGSLAFGQPSSLKVELNQKVTKPTDPTNSNANLTFLGWFNGPVKFDFNSNISSNITLLAKWGYLVTFDAGTDGKFDNQLQTKINLIEKGLGILELENPPTKVGYAFLGWFNGAVKFDFNSSINSNITLLAKWGYLVTFDVNGGQLAAGQPSSLKVELNQKITSPTTPTNSNASLTFLGWFNGTVKFDFNSNINSSITLLAKWGYLVTFDVNGGQLAAGQPSSLKVELNQKVTKPTDPTNSNVSLAFLGWFNGTVKFNFNSNINSNITLLAKWGYLVTFDVNGGQLEAGQPSSIRINPPQKVTSPTDPTNSNASLTFLGWFNGTVKFDFNSIINSSITLTAKWGYRITFNANGGEFQTSSGGKPNLIKYTFQGDLIKKPTETSSALFNDRTKNYKIIGWTTDKTNVSKFNLSTQIISDNIELYALWGYSITFQSGTDGILGTENNKNIVSSLSYASAGGNTIINFPNFPNARYTKTSSNYKIIGWTDANNTDVTFPKTISNNEVFTAKWGFKVTLDSNRGLFTIIPGSTPSNVILSSSTRQVFIFTEASLLENIPMVARSNFRFLGWTVNGTDFNFSTTKVTNTMTAKVKWEAIVNVAVLDAKLSSNNRTGIGSIDITGTTISTSDNSISILSSINTYLRDDLLGLELTYILSNPDKYVWAITCGDRRDTPGLVKRITTATNWTGQDVDATSSLELDPDPSSVRKAGEVIIPDYNFLLIFNSDAETLKITDSHDGADNTYGAIRGMTITIQ